MNVFKHISRNLTKTFALSVLSLSAFATTPPDTTRQLANEEDYYRMVTIPVPEGIVLEVGGLTVMPSGKLAVSTRRGEVYIINNPYMLGETAPDFQLFARCLHEPLGLAYRDGALYLSQRGELTRLVDKNKDGKADAFETVYAWPLSGNYHEYSYGPKIHSDGTMTVTGNVGFFNPEWWKGVSKVPWRGWMLKITPDGNMTPYATGMRSPAGIGIHTDGETFYAENQGDWIGSGAITHVEKGDFVGNPAGLAWSHLPGSPVQAKMEDVYDLVGYRPFKPGEKVFKPEDDPSKPWVSFHELKEKVPAIKPPAVWFPHTIMGISTSDILTNTTGSKFGPFDGQLFVGDQGHSKIMRVALEKVNGVYQGAVFPFREGFMSGVLRMDWGTDGSMFVGMTNRGWGSNGTADYGLQRLVWTGKMPFEMKTVRAMPDGFEIEFTLPVDKNTASNPAAYEITGFGYKYHAVYGSPVVNDKACAVKGVIVSEDGLRARLVVEGLREKYIHELKAEGVRSRNNLPLLHSVAYYTLNNIPAGDRVAQASLEASNQMHNHGQMMQSSKASAKGAVTRTSNTPAKTAPEKTAAAKRLTKMPASWSKGPDQVISIGTEPGLKFDVKAVQVKAGSKIKLVFNNNDDMLHNFVLVAPGTVQEVGDLAIKLGLKGTEKSYIPDTDKVLYHTNLLQPTSSETIYFTAPTQPGEYTYVCTVPGHAYVMQGTLTVVP